MTPQEIEAVARAICSARDPNPEPERIWETWMVEAKAVIPIIQRAMLLRFLVKIDGDVAPNRVWLDTKKLIEIARELGLEMESEQMDCPRKRSDMTPCVLTDGDICYSDFPEQVCVGCGWSKEAIARERGLDLET